MNAKYDTFWRRLGAGFCDGLVFMPLNIADSVIQSYQLDIPLKIAWLLVFVFSRPLYIILMHAQYGQTIGKMATGIIVVHINEDRIINYKEAVLRESPFWITIMISVIITVYYLLAPHAIADEHASDSYTILSYAGLIWYLLEILTMLSNNKRRALHDFIAHSVVIRKEEFKLPELLLESEMKEQP